MLFQVCALLQSEHFPHVPVKHGAAAVLLRELEERECSLAEFGAVALEFGRLQSRRRTQLLSRFSRQVAAILGFLTFYKIERCLHLGHLGAILWESVESISWQQTER